MANLNVVILSGNVSRDPESRNTTNGHNVAKFSIAVNGWKRDDPPTFVDCEAWGKTAETANQFLRKGSFVELRGKLKTESWTDRDTNQKRSKMFLSVEEIVLGPKQANAPSDRQEPQPRAQEGASRGSRQEARREEDRLQDEVWKEGDKNYDPNDEDSLPF